VHFTVHPSSPRRNCKTRKQNTIPASGFPRTHPF
jgi:hypothetical protein